MRNKFSEAMTLIIVGIVFAIVGIVLFFVTPFPIVLDDILFGTASIVAISAGGYKLLKKGD